MPRLGPLAWMSNEVREGTGWPVAGTDHNGGVAVLTPDHEARRRENLNDQGEQGEANGPAPHALNLPASSHVAHLAALDAPPRANIPLNC